MRELTYNKPHNLAQLNDELLAAIPALAPVADPELDPDMPSAKRAVFRCEGREADGFIRIVVPDNVRKSDVDAVIAAHVADPEYGKDAVLTESEFLALPEQEWRRLVARRIGFTS